MNEHTATLSKYLRVLFYVQIASIVITLINAVSYLDSITGWVIKALAIIAIWSLFQMKNASSRYRTAAIAKVTVLICGLLTTPVNTSAMGLSGILALVGGIASWVAAYQEYHGHGEIAAHWDEKLMKKWNSLFVWEVVISLGISTISVFGTTLMIAAGVLSSTITTVIITLSTICGLALDALYLHYMKQTLAFIDA